MNDLAIALLTFGCTFGCAVGAIFVRQRLPEAHLGRDSQDIVRLGMGLVATMTALLLGLVTAAAKNGFDAQDAALKNSAVNILTLDRQLARYGAEAQPVRDLLQQSLAERVAALWPEKGWGTELKDVPGAGAPIEELENRILALEPQTEAQKFFRTEALKLVQDVVKTRWRVLETGRTVQTPFLFAVIFWLTVTFTSFGLFAPRNGTVITVLLIAAFSVAAAVYLVLEMDRPFSGLIRVSGDSLRFALTHLNQ